MTFNKRRAVEEIGQKDIILYLIFFPQANAWVYDINATSNRRGKGGIRRPKFFIFQLNKNNRSDIKI
jgi:hypothetical protein